MAIEKMKLVNIVGPLGMFDQVVRDCVVDSGFAPESVLEFTGGGGLSPFTVKNPSAALLSRVESLADQLEIPLGYHAFAAGQQDEKQICPSGIKSCWNSGGNGALRWRKIGRF